MTNRVEYFIDVEEQDGTKIGSGPITSAAYWRQDYAMDQAGAYATWIPLSDPQAANVENEKVLRCYAIMPSGVVEIGSGVVDHIVYEQTKQGNWGMKLEGLDEMRLLQDRSVNFLQLGGSGSPPTVSHATSISSIGTFAPSGWTFTADPSPPFDEIIYRFRGNSVLNAFVEISKFSKVHFYQSAAKTLKFLSDFTSSGITVTDHPPQGHEQSDDVCFIKSLSYVKETKDITTRIYGYGGWYDGFFTDVFIPLGDVNYALTPSDPDYWPSPKYTGYTDNRTADWIEKDSSKVTWGLREKTIQYPEVKVTFFTGGYSNEIWRDLCRLIYNRTVAELDWYSIEGQFINVQLQNCNTILRPLQTIRLMVNIIEDGRSVLRLDDNFLITQSRIEINSAGVRTASLEVTDAERYRRKDPYTTVSFANGQFNEYSA